MSWQVCPICGGSGMIGAYGIMCNICRGQKIISEQTGKPPKNEELNNET